MICIFRQYLSAIVLASLRAAAPIPCAGNPQPAISQTTFRPATTNDHQ